MAKTRNSPPAKPHPPPASKAIDHHRLAARINLLRPVLKARFGGPVAKIGLGACLGCPHRNAGQSLAECAYCPPDGSGHGLRRLSISEQLRQGQERLALRVAPCSASWPIYTGPHLHQRLSPPPRSPGPEVLVPLLQEALAFPRLAGLIISTHPDCLNPPRWEFISGLSRGSTPVARVGPAERPRAHPGSPGPRP
ncbi:hypothetical protein DFAR_650005 [Desulfarculales bacterium]